VIDMRDIVKRIKNLEIQSATTITIEALLYLKKFVKKNGFGSKFDKECRRLLVRPTAVALFNAISEIKKEKSIEKIDEIIRRIKQSYKKIALFGAPLIKKNYVVHTHCHSTEALAIVKEAAKKKKFTVVVDETRPREQGIKTAKELSKIKNISVILITDNAAGLALSPFIEPNDDIVLVGCDALRKEGVVNKIGTYLLAVAASEQGIPFYVAGSSLKVDKREKVEIEMRPPNEVYRKIKNVKIINPAFDITPWKYVTGVITENGIKKPIDILKMIKS